MSERGADAGAISNVVGIKACRRNHLGFTGFILISTTALIIFAVSRSE